MKAWFLTGPRQLELRGTPDPIPGPDEALIRVRAVGICGSDAECFEGKHPLPNYPRLPGHEFAGEVAAVGSAWTGPPVDTRVVVDPALSCGHCYACRHGRHNCCTEVSIAGVHRPGAMAEYAVCSPSQLFPIPDEMSFETAAVIETLSIGAQVVHRAEVQEDDRVVVLGAGPIGLSSLMMARQRAARVLVSEPLCWRLSLAEDLGADRCVNPEVCALSHAVAEFTDGCGAHVVIEATGEVACAQSAFSLIGQAGRIVVLALSEDPVHVQPWQLVRQELTVLGTRLSLADFSELVELAASGRTPIDRLVTHRYPLHEADRAFQDVCARIDGLVKAVVLP